MAHTLYIVRHAEPIVAGGHRRGLTARGVRNTHKLANTLIKKISKGSTLAILYSQVERCQQTAEIIGSLLDTKPRKKALRFRHIQNMQTHDTESKYTTYMSSYESLGIESPGEYVSRFKKMVASEDSESVIVIANEVNIRVLLHYFTKKPYNKPVGYTMCFKISNIDHLTKIQVQEIL